MAFHITPEALQQLRSWCDWMLAEFLQGTGDSTEGRDLAEPAGRRYASVYALKLKGQPYDELVLSKMEASASVRWLAKWRLESHLQISSKAEEPTSSTSQWRAWIDWAKGTGSETVTESGPPKEAWAERGEEGFSVEALLSEVDSGELPELATPTRFELHMQISQYTALCDASGGSAGRFYLQPRSLPIPSAGPLLVEGLPLLQPLHLICKCSHAPHFSSAPFSTS